MALIPGSRITTSKITEHTKTNIWICEQLLPIDFKIEGNKITSYKRE